MLQYARSWPEFQDILHWDANHSCMRKLTITALKSNHNRSLKLSQIQKIVSYKRFLEFYLVYKNVRLKFLRQKIQKLEIENFVTISSNFPFFLIFTKLNKLF